MPVGPEPPTQVFRYEETTESKLSFFSLILDDFEGYIQSYWEKTQSEKWDDVDVLPESFRIDYIDNQFDEDFYEEDDIRMAKDEEGDGDDYCYTDLNHVNSFSIKKTPKNIQTLKDEADLVYKWELWDEYPDDIMVETLTEWSWFYYSRPYYSWMIKENFSCDTGIPFDEIEKGDICVNG